MNEYSYIAKMADPTRESQDRIIRIVGTLYNRAEALFQLTEDEIRAAHYEHPSLWLRLVRNWTTEVHSLKELFIDEEKIRTNLSQRLNNVTYYESEAKKRHDSAVDYSRRLE